MKIRWKRLIVCLMVPVAVGGLAALLAGGSFENFESLNKPPLSPPGWLFPVAWTLLYLLMGGASYLALASGEKREQMRCGQILYALQLAVNFFWPLFFFRLEMYLFSLVWLAALWGLILLTLLSFRRVSGAAGNLMFPYLIWVSFAGYLNWGIYMLN